MGPVRSSPPAAFPNRVPGVSSLTAWAGAGAVFFSISRVHQHFGVLIQLRALALLSAGSLALLVFAQQAWRPSDLTKHWLPRGIATIAAIAVLGVPFSIYPGRSFAFVTGPFPKTLLLGVVTWAIARTPRGARFMAKTVAASGLGAVILTRLLARDDGGGRLSGAYTYDPNDIALIAVVTLPLVIWWIVESRRLLKFLLLACMPVIIDTIFRTDSRSGALGLGAVALGLFFSLRRRGPLGKVNWIPRVIIIAAIVAIPLLPDDYVQRLTSMGSEDDYNRSSETGRLQIWKRGIGYALTHPVFGVGIDNFNTAEGHLAVIPGRDPDRGFKWSTAHNSFVLVLAELGIFAGFLFVILILRTIRTLSFGPARSPPDLDLLGIFVGVCWIGFSVSGFFLSFAYYDIVYVLFGLSGGVMICQTPALPSAGPVRRRSTVPPRRR